MAWSYKEYWQSTAEPILEKHTREGLTVYRAYFTEDIQTQYPVEKYVGVSPVPDSSTLYHVWCNVSGGDREFDWIVDTNTDYFLSLPSPLDIIVSDMLSIIHSKKQEPMDTISVPGYTGTYYCIDSKTIGDTVYYLLEHEQFGDEAPCLITKNLTEVVLDDVYDGFNDLTEYLERN